MNFVDIKMPGTIKKTIIRSLSAQCVLYNSSKPSKFTPVDYMASDYKINYQTD